VFYHSKSASNISINRKCEAASKKHFKFLDKIETYLKIRKANINCTHTHKLSYAYCFATENMTSDPEMEFCKTSRPFDTLVWINCDRQIGPYFHNFRSLHSTERAPIVWNIQGLIVGLNKLEIRGPWPIEGPLLR
jgi:hypothetical protein